MRRYALRHYIVYYAIDECFRRCCAIFRFARHSARCYEMLQRWPHAAPPMRLSHVARRFDLIRYDTHDRDIHTYAGAADFRHAAFRDATPLMIRCYNICHFALFAFLRRYFIA